MSIENQTPKNAKSKKTWKPLLQERNLSAARPYERYYVLWVAAEGIERVPDKYPGDTCPGHLIGICGYIGKAFWIVHNLVADLLLSGPKEILISLGRTKECSSQSYCLAFECPLNKTTRESYCKQLDCVRGEGTMNPKYLPEDFGQVLPLNRDIDWTKWLQGSGQLAGLDEIKGVEK